VTATGFFQKKKRKEKKKRRKAILVEVNQLILIPTVDYRSYFNKIMTQVKLVRQALLQNHTAD